MNNEDRIKEEVTQAVKDAVNLNVPSYLRAMLPEVYEIDVHAVTDQEICVRVKEIKEEESRHFSVRITEAVG